MLKVPVVPFPELLQVFDKSSSMSERKRCGCYPHTVHECVEHLSGFQLHDTLQFSKSKTWHCHPYCRFLKAYVLCRICTAHLTAIQSMMSSVISPETAALALPLFCLTNLPVVMCGASFSPFGLGENGAHADKWLINPKEKQQRCISALALRADNAWNN